MTTRVKTIIRPLLCHPIIVRSSYKKGTFLSGSA
jgi:hypothetical protein